MKKRSSTRGRRYGGGAKRAVAGAMRRRTHGALEAGKGRHPRAKSRKQAIAIGLSEARRKGAKVPRRRKGGR